MKKLPKEMVKTKQVKKIIKKTGYLENIQNVATNHHWNVGKDIRVFFKAVNQSLYVVHHDTGS